MKIILTIFLAIGLVFAFFGCVLAENQTTSGTTTPLEAAPISVLSSGARSQEVKAMQEILKEVPGSSFVGQATGYFGPVTKRALQKLQAKCNIAQSGELDEETEKCLFPGGYQITIVSPNGGEIWDRSQIQTIKWTWSATGSSLKTDSKPLWSKASIDLFRQVAAKCEKQADGQEVCPSASVRPVFVKHIAVVDMFDGSYSWKIGNSIPNGSDYVVRISLGRGIWPLYLQEQGEANTKAESAWSALNLTWDQSDNHFSITGSVPPADSDLKKILEMLEQISQQLAKVSQLLKGMIAP